MQHAKVLLGLLSSASARLCRQSSRNIPNNRLICPQSSCSMRDLTFIMILIKGKKLSGDCNWCLYWATLSQNDIAIGHMNDYHDNAIQHHTLQSCRLTSVVKDTCSNAGAVNYITGSISCPRLSRYLENILLCQARTGLQGSSCSSQVSVALISIYNRCRQLCNVCPHFACVSKA